MTWRKNTAQAILHAVILLVGTRSFAEDLRFFDEPGIDYWAKPDNPVEPPRVEQSRATEQPEQRHRVFDWQKVMDPQNDDFFREGDYLPPAAFMEVARDPSDQNIRMWRAYIERKNTLISRLQERFVEYSAKSDPQAALTSSATLPAVAAAPAPKPRADAAADQDPKRFQFKMFFDSECPHCRRMMTTLTDLARRGFVVEAKQVRGPEMRPMGLPFPIDWDEDGEAKRYGVSVVPFLLIADSKDQVTYRMTGFKTMDQIFSEISARHSSH